MAGRAAAAPVLAQGGGRGPGHRAHRCRIRSAQPPGRDDRGRRRAAAAGRVVRPRRDLALPGRRRPAHPPGSADCHRGACAHGPVVRPCGARPGLAVQPRRFCPHPSGSAGPGCRRAGAAALATADRGRYRRTPVQRAHSRQDPQHRDVGGGRSGVQPAERLEQHQAGRGRGTRRYRHHAHKRRARRDLGRYRPAGRRHHRGNDSRHRRGRPSPPRHRPRPCCSHSHLGRCPRACHCSSPRGLRSPRPAPPGWPSRRCAPTTKRSATRVVFTAADPQPRSRGHHPRFGPADRIARQGRPHRLRRKLRAGRRPGFELLAGRRRRPAPAKRHADPRRLVHAERLDDLPDVRRDQLARPLHPAVRAVG